jgi:hypothetical protein
MADTVRTAGPRLREENARRLTAEECTIGIDYELSEEERKDRAALNSAFRNAKAAGKRCHWKGGELFVDRVRVPAPSRA